MRRKRTYNYKLKSINAQTLKSTKAQILGIKIPLFMMPILIIFGIATVYLTIETATSGANLAALSQREAVLIRENDSLASELVKNSSLNGLGEKSEEMGFVKPQVVIYISEKDAVANLP